MRSYAYLLFLLIATSDFNFSFASETAKTIPKLLVIAPKRKLFFQTSGPKTIINKQDIASSGFATLAQTLQALGGVQLQDMLGNGSQISLGMRGFGSNASSNTLLLINGIPITNPDMAAPDINAISPNNIALIEIIAGSESVLYGDQAVGGVINVLTNTDKKNKAEFVFKTGSYNQRDILAFVASQNNLANFNLALEDSRNDNYRENNRAIKQALLGNINYFYATGYLKFDYTLSNENMRYPGALTALQVRQNRRQAQNPINYFNNTNGSLHLQHKQNLYPEWYSNLDLAYRQMDGDGMLTSNFSQFRNSIFLKQQLNGKINNIKLILGVDLQADLYRLNSLYGNTNNHLQKYSVFSLANIKFNSLWQISFGARGAQQNNQLISYTNSNTINRAWVTTIGSNYLFSPQYNFYLRRAESFRFPKADENASAPIGVTALKTQRGVAYESGIEINKEKYSGKIGLYTLYLKDEINYDPLQTPQQPFGSNTNLNPTLRYGLSFSNKYRVNSKINLDAQYNWVNARFQSGVYKNKRIPLVAENTFHAGLDVNLIKNWFFYLETIYTGSQYSANDNANIAKKIGGYTTFNFNLRYVYRNISATLHVNNIFNKRYYFYTAYQPSVLTQYFYPAPERNFSLSLTYNFI